MFLNCSYVRDATASMAVAFSLFNFPAKRPTLFDDDDEDNDGKGKFYIRVTDILFFNTSKYHG